MANTRVFEAQHMTCLGVAVGGLAQVTFNPTFRTIVESSPDGAVGAEDADVLALRADVGIELTDVAKVNEILAAADGDVVFDGRESGAATYQRVTLGGTGGDVVMSGMDLSIPRESDATLRLNGVIRFADGTKNMGDVLTLLAAQVAGTQTYPARLYRAHTISFDPDGVPGAIAPIHVESLNLSLAASQVLEDSGDNDIGMTGVDRLGWGLLRVSVTHKDRSVQAGSDRSAELLEAVRGVLTATLTGRGGAANKTLTVNNLLWQGVTQTKGKDFWSFTLNGVAGWRSTAGVAYAMNSGTKLFSIA